MRPAALMLAGLLTCGWPASGQAAGPPRAAPPSSPRTPASDDSDRIKLTGDGEPEEWWLSISPLPGQHGQSLPDHAVVFVGLLSACRTPRTFPIVFTVNGGDRIEKRGALLSRQKQGAGCVDALATVFPAGSTSVLTTATSLAVALPDRRFELSAPQLDFVRRALTVEAANPASPATTSSLTTSRPLPSAPEARALANQALDLHEDAIRLVGLGKLRDARKRALSAVELAEKAWGPGHAETGSFFVTLGFIDRKLGDNAAAATHYRRAVELLEPKGPSESLGVALDNLGRVLQDQKDLDGAIASTSRAVDVLMQTVGPSDAHVGYALNNLALLWSAKGDHAKALELSDRAIAVLRPALGPENPALRPFLDDQRDFQKRARKP